MKITHLLIAFICTVTLVSCKQEKTETTPGSESAVEEINNINVTLEIVVKKDDDFQLFYAEEVGKGFTQEQSKIVLIKGSDKPQLINFGLADELHPKDLRIDFGGNREQEKMEIKSFTVEYFGKKFTAKGSEFFKYFFVNDNLTADEANATLTPKVVNGNYDPQCYCTELMLQTLHGLVPNKEE